MASARDVDYRDLVEGARDVIFSIDHAGVLTSLNPAFERLTGFARKDWIGRSFVHLLHPDDEELAVSYFSWAMQDAPRRDTHFRIRTGRDSFLVAEIFLSRFERDGVVAGVVGVGRDVTALLQAEAQRRETHATEAVNRLAGRVAHEFNNLLTVIAGHAELLQAGVESGHADPRDVEAIQKAVDIGAATTGRLLALSEQQVLMARHVDLRDVVNASHGAIRQLAGNAVALYIVSGPRPATVVADRAQLELVLMNLAKNAREAMSNGGEITIEVGVEVLSEGELPPAAGAKPGAYATIVVRDTGGGMDDEVKARMFEPYFTTRASGGSSGLGLSTVSGVMKQSGGFVNVRSAPGAGTTITLYLPLISPSVAPTPLTEPITSPRGDETVLVVGGAVAVRALIVLALTKRGYMVLEAGDGVTAVHIAGRHAGPIDLVITDLAMPGMSGPELARHIRAARPTRVLYTSGFEDDATLRLELVRSGAAFIQKPFTPTRLARRVREVLESAPH